MSCFEVSSRQTSGQSPFDPVLAAMGLKSVFLSARPIVLYERAVGLRRGFSKHTVDALLAHGISAPERLLFMTETELQNISGIGASSLAEILRYRKQHLSGA